MPRSMSIKAMISGSSAVRPKSGASCSATPRACAASVARISDWSLACATTLKKKRILLRSNMSARTASTVSTSLPVEPRLRLMRLRMRRFERRGEQIRLARKIIGQMRLPQSGRGGDASLGQRRDAFLPEDFERSVQNALTRAFFHHRHSRSFQPSPRQRRIKKNAPRKRL